MNTKWLLLLPLLATVAVSGCRTVRAQGPEIKIPPAKKQLSQAKRNLKQKAAVSKMPAVLGGLVQSDSWIIYKDKQQEEFKGNVSYDNGTYRFRADYALSERALHRFTAKGNVYLRQAETNAPEYQAYADYARYNYKTQKGILTANKGKQIRLIYTDKKNGTATAYAKKAEFDLNEQIFILEGNVRVVRDTPQGPQTLTADKATYRQAKNHLLLEGGASASDSLRTLEADTIIYDGNNNASYAYGSRPLLHGTSEEGTFAIIADKVQTDNEGKKIILDGKVQGWAVSPRLNEASANTKF